MCSANRYFSVYFDDVSQFQRCLKLAIKVAKCKITKGKGSIRAIKFPVKKYPGMRARHLNVSGIPVLVVSCFDISYLKIRYRIDIGLHA